MTRKISTKYPFDKLRVNSILSTKPMAIALIALALFNIQSSICNSQSIARSSISSAGGTLTGGSSQITFNIGETVIPTLSAGSNIITQGFEQPGEQVRTGAIAADVCAGSTISIPYTAIDIAAGNTFTAELSDAAGSFALAVGLGTQAGNSSGSMSVTIPSNTTPGIGYRVRVNASTPFKEGTPNTTNINIVAAPTANAGSDQEICAPNVVFLNGLITGGSNFVWSTSGDGFFTNAATLSPTYTTGVNDKSSGNVNLTLVSTNPGCSSTPDVLTVKVRLTLPLQPATVTGAPVSICPPQTGLTLVTNNDPNATSYSWANSPGSNGITFNPVSTTNTQVIDVGTTVNSTYNIRVTATNACGSSLYRGVSIRRTTSTPASIAGSTVACAGQTYTYSTPVVVGAETYTWTATAGSSINGGGNTLTTASPSVSVQMPAVFSTGTVSVTANVACFVSSARVLNIGSTTPALTIVAGSVIACPGSSQTYTVPPSAGAVSYQWTLPVNTSGTSSTNSINVTFNTGFSSANICVQATSVCGVQTIPRCKSVATGLPPTPTALNGIANGICGQTVIYTTPAVQGATGYVWTLPAGASGASTSNSILVTYAPTGITTAPLTVRSQNACGLSLPRTITIKGAPNSPGTITANPVSWCNTDPSIAFTSNLGNVTGSYNLVWSFVPPTAASIQNGQGSNNLLVDWNTGNATVILTASNNCGSGTKTYSAVIGCRQAGEAIEQEVGSIAVYPNPAIDKVNIAFTTETSGNSTVKLLDVTGKVVMSNNYAFTAGSNTLQLDVAHLAKGVYMLEVKANTINNKTRLVIQ